MRILNGCKWTTIKDFFENFDHIEGNLEKTECFFDEIMLVVPTLTLHDDALMQIDDALAELEASDYREWV